MVVVQLAPLRLPEYILYGRIKSFDQIKVFVMKLLQGNMIFPDKYFGYAVPLFNRVTLKVNILEFLQRYPLWWFFFFSEGGDL